MPAVKELKLTLGDLKMKEASLGNLLNTKLPVKASYRMSKLSKIIINELKELEEQRVKLVEKYGEKTDQGFAIKPDNAEMWKAFHDDYKELLKEEVALSFIPVLLNDIPDNVLSAIDMMHLSEFIEEGKDD